MSVAIWLTGPLSLTGSLLEKIGQLTIPYQLILVAEQETASGYVADPGVDR